MVVEQSFVMAVLAVVSWLALVADTNAEPPSSYLPPSSNAGGPAKPSTAYGPPNFQPGRPLGVGGGVGGGGGGSSGALRPPSSSYGTPETSRSAASQSPSRPQFNASPPKASYGPPNNQQQQQSSADTTEPAKYQFEYEVSGPEFNVQFGHQESRDGDRATGEYNVLLPDGRKQIVQYEADDQGFRPKISYEGGDQESGPFQRGGGGGGGGSGPRSQSAAGASPIGGGYPPAGRPGAQSGASSGNGGQGYPTARNGQTQASIGAGAGSDGYPRGGPGNFRDGPNQGANQGYPGAPY